MLGLYELNVGIPDGIKIPLKKGFPPIAIDKSGNIYVTDQGNDKVRKITIQ